MSKKKMSSHTIVGQAIILNRQWLSLPSLVSQILCTFFGIPCNPLGQDSGTLVLWASFISTLLLIAGVPCFISTLISMPCGLSDHWYESFGNYNFRCELRWLQHLSHKMLTQGPVFAQQLCGTGRFRGQSKFYFNRPGYLFFCFSRWQDIMNLG